MYQFAPLLGCFFFVFEKSNPLSNPKGAQIGLFWYYVLCIKNAQNVDSEHFGTNWYFVLAEREGFEPSVPFWGTYAFQAYLIGHSSTSPSGYKLSYNLNNFNAFDVVSSIISFSDRL